MDSATATRRVRTWPRLRFSLASLLLLTTLCAVLLVVWKTIIYEPPTHKIAAYEKAPGTLRDSFIVGPNRVRMHLVTRNDRDGTLHHENGRGHVLKLSAQNAQVLSQAAPWLDVVQIELQPSPDRVDIIEARVFDHKTRTLINSVDPAFGWRMAAPDVLQIYGLGKRIPDELDVWFRLHSYSPSDEVRTIPPTPASSCEFSSGAKITLSDIRSGLGGGWSSAKGFLGTASSDDNRVAAEFTVEKPLPGDEKLQIAAVLHSGEKIHPDVPHFIASNSTSLEPKQLILFDADLADVHHFEVRPFGGRHRFFFESVTLPQVSNKPFFPPPMVKVNVGGGEVDEQLAAFAPLDVRISTYRGMWAGGTTSNNRRATIMRSASVTDKDQAFTFISSISGLRLLPRPQFVLVNSTSPSRHVSMTTTGFGGSASGGNCRVGCVSYRTPLDQVDAVEITLAP